MPNPDQEYNDKVRAMTEEEDRKDRLAGMSDDEILAEWERAVSALQAQAAPYAKPHLVAPGSILASSFRPEEFPNVDSATQNGRLKMKMYETYGPSGSAVQESMETPYSAFANMMHHEGRPGRFTVVKTDSGGYDYPVVPTSPEYKKVQELYGPARIAYARKNNIDMNTGEPKK